MDVRTQLVYVVQTYVLALSMESPGKAASFVAMAVGLSDKQIEAIPRKVMGDTTKPNLLQAALDIVNSDVTLMPEWLKSK